MVVARVVDGQRVGHARTWLASTLSPTVAGASHALCILLALSAPRPILQPVEDEQPVGREHVLAAIPVFVVLAAVLASRAAAVQPVPWWPAERPCDPLQLRVCRRLSLGT